MRFDIPAMYRSQYLDFHWNQAQLWNIKKEVSLLNIENFEWLFDFPVWASFPPKKIFDITPRQALENSNEWHCERILKSDLQFPIHIFFQKNKWQVLDGIHRLTKAYFFLKKSTITAYILDSKDIEMIKIEDIQEYLIKY